MKKRIAVVGLGYVGLPLAVEFAKKYPTVGLDTNISRINEINKGYDKTFEIEDIHLKNVLTSNLHTLEKNNKGLYCTTLIKDIEPSNFYIITVPTPINKNNTPDLIPLIQASESVGKVLKKGDHVVYESTVYPGVTEDICVPILENFSGLKINKDIFVGYSPERINPGDKQKTITKILKITSGSTPKAAKIIDEMYRSVITAGTYLAPSIKVAEAAKVIENCQRDINIAFVNELAIIFNKIGIDTHSVLEAAATKWNFLSFKPGLVGGHCIGVDPYYLSQKAQEVGYHPEIILGGRRLNDRMGKYVADEFIKLMVRKSISLVDANVLMLGVTFKENCPDIRNTRAVDIYKELLSYNLNVDVYDPLADFTEVREEYGIELLDALKKKYHAIILTVAHDDFLDKELSLHKVEGGVIYDVKSVLEVNKIDGRL